MVMVLQLRKRTISFPRRPLIMGIVNVNDDSFCGDGSLDAAELLETIRAQAAAGADVIDLGAESARTNRGPISCEEEIRRLTRVLDGWQGVFDGLQAKDDVQVWPPVLSINTWRAPVIGAVLEHSAVELINDMSGLPDASHARLCAERGAALLIMHSVGMPKVPHVSQQWEDVVAAMDAFFVEKIGLCEAAGLSRASIMLDPGIDFAKQRDDNLKVYRDLGNLQRFGCAVLVPVSRKTVIGKVLEISEPTGRDAGTLACIATSMRRGAQIFRVHNVPAAWQAVKVLHAITG